jgi:putative ABC transport system ATP-binding protein
MGKSTLGCSPPSSLTKTYVSGEVTVQALRGIDLEISAGEVVVLLGPSGSGKSTLLNILGGLDHATSGRVLFHGTDLTGLDDRRLTRYGRDHVGFEFQFYNLVPSLAAYENVALVTEIADDPIRPDDALALVGLEERMDHFPRPAFGWGAAAGGNRARDREAGRMFCCATSLPGPWIRRPASA